jgi:hypothetical protein
MISGFHHEVDESRVLPGYYAASSGNLLPTFRDNLSGPVVRGQESISRNSDTACNVAGANKQNFKQTAWYCIVTRQKPKLR